MGVPAALQRIVGEFKARHGLDATPQHLAATIHLMNEHRLDKESALDQSSRGKDDHGLDAWALNTTRTDLFIYQSKFTDSRELTQQGFDDLRRAADWLTTALCDEKTPHGVHEHSVGNLLNQLARHGSQINQVTLVLLTLVAEDEVRAEAEFDDLIEALKDSRLHALLKERGGGVNLEVTRHNFRKGVPRIQKTYGVKTFKDTRLKLRESVHLSIAYLSLAGLVHLFRERGIVLFDKNVRLSLISYKDAANRVVHPMEETLTSICQGTLPVEVFPFYHLGITIWAAHEKPGVGDVLDLEAPSVVNGCQTVTIADRFLRSLEAKKDDAAITRFEQIRVIAKVVIGANEAELREITNSNNRQNPIENWQLFSNDDVHIQIELALEELGVFYERQKGKFKSLSDEIEVRDRYPNTRDTCITIPELGQVVALTRNALKLAAKSSELFANNAAHNSIFGSSVVDGAKDIVFACNLLKASRRAFKKVLDAKVDTHPQSRLLDKPLTRCHFWQLGMLYGFERLQRSVDGHFTERLNKSAPSTLVGEIEAFYAKFFLKTVRFYSAETGGGESELSQRKRETYFRQLTVEKGLNPAKMPFRGA